MAAWRGQPLKNQLDYFIWMAVIISHDERLNFFQWRVVLESKTKAQNSN